MGVEEEEGEEGGEGERLERDREPGVGFEGCIRIDRKGFALVSVGSRVVGGTCGLVGETSDDVEDDEGSAGKGINSFEFIV